MDKCTKIVKIISIAIIFITAAKTVKDAVKSSMVILGCTKLLKAAK